MVDGVYEINTNSDYKARLIMLTEAYIGKIFSGEKYLNALFSYANEVNADAIIFMGGMLYMDMKKHSSKKNLRALTSEEYISKDILEKSLPDVVKRDDWSELEELLNDEEGVEGLSDDMYEIKNILTSYASSDEKKDSLVKKVKNAFKKNNEYGVPVRALFGANEENFVESSGNDELREDTKEDQGKLSNKVKKLEYVLKIAYKRLDYEKDEENRDRVEGISNWIKRLERGLEKLKRKKSKVIMTNALDSRRKKYIIKAEKRFKEDIKNAIPNFEWLPKNGMFRVNNTLVKASYSTYKISNNPLLSATKILRTNIGRRVYEGRTDNIRMFVQGGLQGVFSSLIMLDTSGYNIDELPIGIHTSENHDRNIFAVQLPPFMNKDCLRKVLEEEVLIPAGEKPQKMIHKIPNVATGAVVTDFLNSDGAFVRYKYLTTEFLEDYQNNKIVAEPPNFSFISRGDDHLGSATTKLIYLSDEDKRRAEEFLKFNLGNNLFRVNRAETAVYNLFPHHSIFYNGDNVQAMNYDLYLEKYYDKNMFEFSEGLKESVDKAFYSLRDKFRKNAANVQDQFDDFIGLMVDLPKRQNKEMINNARKLGIKGPLITFVAGNHSKHSDTSGLNINKQFADIARRTYDVSEEEIVHGSIGSGTGYLPFRWGLENNLYDFVQKHKWSSTHKGQLKNVLGRAAVIEQRRTNFRLGGHTHTPASGFNGQEYVFINGSAQDNNEWKEMLNLPPSTTASWWVNTPAESKGPVSMVPLTLELIMRALTNPEEIKRIIDENFRFYSG